MTIRELYEKLDTAYPKSLSCDWDNDGVMVCADAEREVGRVLVALDANAKTLAYAVQNGFDTIVTHHPMVFRGLKSVSNQTVTGQHAITALQNGITVLSFHTRLDAAEGGVNDALCAALGLIPDEAFGDDDAPTLGRLATLPEPMPAREFAAQVKVSLGCTAVRLNGDGDTMVQRLAVCGGDGKDFLYPAIMAGADVYLTGDAGYNMAADAVEDGLITIEAGHYHTEAPICTVLAERLRSLGIVTEIYDSCSYEVV